MNVAIFVCATAAGMIETEADIGDSGQILYKTPDANAETGEILQYLVVPPRSAASSLGSFAGKYLLVAMMD